MKIEEIEIIRIALDTEETHKDFVKNITESKIILNKEEKAIAVAHSSLLLKEKEIPTFEEWVKLCYHKTEYDTYVSKIGAWNNLRETDVLEKYKYRFNL